MLSLEEHCMPDPSRTSATFVASAFEQTRTAEVTMRNEPKSSPQKVPQEFGFPDENRSAVIAGGLVTVTPHLISECDVLYETLKCNEVE